MRLRTSLSFYSTAFFTTLGLVPLSACGGSTFDTGTTGDKQPEGGPSGAGGGATGGARPTGGSDAGGAGGRPGGSGPGGAGGFSAGGAGASDPTGGRFTGGFGGGAGSTTVPPACRNPRPDSINGQPTGFVICEGGESHRVEKRDCPSLVPRADAVCTPPFVVPDGGYTGSCKTDADCTDKPNGVCSTGGQVANCFCSYGCIRDEDCGAGKICQCGDPVGYCISATCTTDQDCGNGLACLSYVVNPGCGGTAFACQTPMDDCVNGSDCAAGSVCALVNGAHSCQNAICRIGRPFLVAGEARTAGVASRRDWSAALAPAVGGLSRPARAALAARWTEIGLMEHASIAAFARFALELLSFGAPPELLIATHSAMEDETRHARDAFALVSAYAGRDIGPGPLAIDGAFSSRSPLDVVRTAILEGCIGETVAAVEAAESLAYATDDAVRDVLARVTVEEQRHAELAWRFVKWVIEAGPTELRARARRELVSIVEGETVRAERSEDSSDAAADPSLLDHGVLPESIRCEIRRRVLRDVVLPCARALADSDSRRLRRDSDVVGSAGVSIGAV